MIQRSRLAPCGASLWLLTATVCAASCGGELTGRERDAGRGRDAFMAPDVFTTTADAFAGPADAWAPPGADTRLPDAFAPDATTRCASVFCLPNASCVEATGECVCNSGFFAVGGTCISRDPALRTMSQVCTFWRAGQMTSATSPWTPGATMCEPGSMPSDAIEDALKRLNTVRTLVGLEAVTHDASRTAEQQACAVMMHRNAATSASPPPSWGCYTSGGASAAASSSLTLGVTSAAHAVTSFVNDMGEPALRNRRWLLGGDLGRVSFGFAVNASCVHDRDTTGSTSRRWTAFPPPGPAPLETTSAWWSFHGFTANVSGATVRMTRMSDGVEVTGAVHRLPDGFGPTAVAWSPTEAVSGRRYHIAISGTALGLVEYDVEIVTCP